MFDLMDFYKFLTTKFDSYEDRLVKNTKQGRYIIDTCYCNDTEKFETAINKDNGQWIVVEEYETKELAKNGHKKWVEFTKANPQKAYSIQLETFIMF